MVAAIAHHLSVITALISNGTTIDALTQDVIVDILTAGGVSKMQIREALTGPWGVHLVEALNYWDLWRSPAALPVCQTRASVHTLHRSRVDDAARGPVKAGTTNAFAKSLAVQATRAPKRSSINAGGLGSSMGAPQGGRAW